MKRGSQLQAILGVMLRKNPKLTNGQCGAIIRNIKEAQKALITEA